MARRRGLGNSERFGLDMLTVSATGTAFAGPCFLYSIDASLANSAASGIFSFGDSTASADLVKESSKINVTLGAGGASAFCDRYQRSFCPPLFINSGLCFTNSTGINSISVGYMAAF